MSNLRKILAIICVFALVIGMMAGCKEKDPQDTTVESTGSDVVAGQTTNYVVNIKSAGGLPLAGVTLFVYNDEALTDLEGYGQTDASGQAVISLEGAACYYLVLSGVPEGYIVDASYAMSSSSVSIELTSQVIADSNHSGVSYELGSVMHDFTVTACNGNTYTLSELLQEKDAVILNFWYTTCSYCVQEFPYLDAIYQKYSDSVEVLALNNTGYDTDSEVADFCNYFYDTYDSDASTTGGLSFPVANEELGVGNAFSLSGYPTTVVVDRYGVVSFIYAGGLPSDAYWTYIFEAFIGEDYTQTLYSDMSDLVPSITPTYEMPSSDEIAAVLNGSDMTVNYTGEEGEDAETTWPFIIGEKAGVSCVYASNAGVENSYATMYANVTLEAGDVVAFDYYTSSEYNTDVLYVLVDRNDVYQISGEGSGWQTCYTWVAEEAGEYEIAFCYFKDSSDNVGDDTVYLSNLRVVSVDDIDIATYIPRDCATNLRADGFGYENYSDVVFNEADGYYHVGSKNGPLLLASLMMPTKFSNDPIYTLAYNGELTTVDGYDYYEDILPYCTMASNSQIYSLVAVNQELKDLLVKVAEAVGVEQTENEWLQICSFYSAYGTNGVELTDPAAGLAAYNAYPVSMGTNYVSYDRVIMPRGLLCKFVPSKSGVYRITSLSDTYVNGWIFTEQGLTDREPFYEYWFNERAWEDEMNVSMVVYLEAGKEYFIDIAYYDVYGTGTIEYTIEYVASQLDHLVLASPGFFTYYDESTYDVVAGGIEVKLGSDGYYHELLADGSLGSKLYVDMVSYSNIFNDNSLFELINSGAFNFAITEDDQWIIDYYDYFEDLDFNGTDFETCMEDVWGEDFDYYWEYFQVDDVLDGVYHGTGKDVTAIAKKYADQIYTSGDLAGCVAVNEELGEVLQMLMDKFTFDGVENSWIKLCYYYDYLGPDSNK